MKALILLFITTGLWIYAVPGINNDNANAFQIAAFVWGFITLVWGVTELCLMGEGD